MQTEYRLAIAPVVEFTARLVYTDGGAERAAAVVLLARRMSEPELKELRSDATRTVADLLVEQVTGWRDQTLVLDADGLPAAYSADALRCLLSLPGAANVAFAAYIRAISVEGKRGN